MALPTSKRPKEVEEELREELEAKRRGSLIIKINLHYVFAEEMKAWYIGLNQREKSSLSPRLLKRQAIAICYSLKLLYENLPFNWVTRLQSECGLKFKDKPKKKEKSEEWRTDKNPSPKRNGVGGITKPLSKKKIKNIRDLTQEPPPPEWLRAYSRGTSLPRVLKTYSTEATNYVFWDYSPSLSLGGQQLTLSSKSRQNEREVKARETK